MRVRWTIVGFALFAVVTGTAAYANPHGRPPTTTPHAQTPKTTTTPTTPTTTGTTTTSGSKSSTTSGSTSSNTSGSTTPPPTGKTTTLNPIAAKIMAKPQLNAKIKALLAPTGMTLNQASMGFENQGQFIAALHAARNLGCNCFKQLQTDMTKKGMSLGQAIQDVKKTSNTTVEARKAETEADDDVKTSTQTGSTTTPTPTTTGSSTKKRSSSDR